MSIEKPLDYHSPGLSGSVPGSTLVPGTGLQLTRNVSCVACGCENTKRTGCLVWLPYPQVSTLCSTRTSPLPSLLSGLGTGGNYGPMVANALFHCMMACQEADWPYKGPVSIEQPLDYHSPGLSGSVPGSTLVPGTGL